MTSLHKCSEDCELETTSMTVSADVNWKQRYEQLHFEQQLELERIRLHYDRELKEKLNEVCIRLKNEYDHQFSEFRARLLEQRQLYNISLSSLNLDQTIGKQVHEQLRIAEEYDHYEGEQCRQIILQQSIDNNQVQQLIHKLHTEGVHVLTLSELLSLRLNGLNISVTNESSDSLQKLYDENSYLRSLIANMNSNENSNTLIKCLTDIFRCEQERRLMGIREHKDLHDLEQEIHDMCDYQRNALSKLLSQDRFLLINELEQTKEELNDLKGRFKQLKQNQSILMNSQHLNKFYFKYLRCEAYRKALIYQKRYLIVLLNGYEDTENFALNEIRRLTGDVRPNHYNNDEMKLSFRHKYHRRSLNCRFRFRCCITVVIGMVRMRWLVKKWAKKLATIQ